MVAPVLPYSIENSTMESKKKKMKIHNNVNNWSYLPTEILQNITKQLRFNPKDVRNFRAVCKQWRNSTLISTYSPRLTNSLVPKKVISSSIYLLHSDPSMDSAHKSPWMVLAVEHTKRIVSFYHPFTRTKLGDVPSNLNLTRFRPIKVSTAYHLVFDDPSNNPFSFRRCPFVKTLLSSNSSTSSIEDSVMLSLSDKFSLVKSFPFGNDRKETTIRGAIGDVIEYKGIIFTLSNNGFLHSLGKLNSPNGTRLSYGFTKLIGNSSHRRRLVVSLSGEKLYLIVPIMGSSDKGVSLIFKVYEKKQYATTNGWFWDEVRSFEGDQVLFVSKDHCFFVEASEVYGCRKNCIVFSEDGFPKWAKSGWEYENIRANKIAVFSLEFNNGYSLLLKDFSSFLQRLCSLSPPNWFSQIMCLYQQSESQSQSQSQSESESESQSQSRSEPEAEEVMQSDSNTTTSATRQSRPPSTINEEECVVEEAPDPKSPRKGSLCRPYLTSTNQSNTSKTPTTKFEGLDIKSNLIPTLQKIWSKHGNIIENCILSNGDLKSRALELVANVVLTLEENSALDMSDDQSDNLKSTLTDLRVICFDVNWLAPYVEKALELHQSKPLVESLHNLGQLKIQASVQKSRLLKELAKLDDLEKEYDEGMANLSKLLPFTDEVGIEKPLGAGFT
ncbi:unnamed protein product [Amaranthus hypochondriacus]